MNKEITIYDIAKDLGVSPTTVSRALNDHPAVNVKTKQKIFDAAKQMGYRSNVFASNLRSKKTNNIGIIVPRLNSSFQSSVLAGMEKVANDAGFNLIISQSLESSEKEKANARTMFNSRVDGLLVSLASNTENVEHFNAFLDKGTPVLFFDRVASNSGCTGVVIDNTQAAYNATKHLIEQGCKNIIHVLGNTKINVYADRLKGYKYALMDHEIPFNSKNVIYSDLNEEAGEDIANKIINKKTLPDGLFVSNDACAASCIQTLKQAGIRIPEDIAVVGFNNDIISRLIEPNLTTTHYPGYEMGEVAMKNLINHLGDNSKGVLQNTNTITLRSELIVRSSSLRQKTT
ncbi:LacI family DNA-binding transcriptional regulator [Echinicola sp. CAU 1574]|uniref:LacI family DNA-binding transcriptional regulator n=1 Tax=Echinicola arenosa TaxID=2774144 RepID=A0ABR9AGV9_9BACT|nr:LacI family DNA-binding transcriptional regulator [Echinicola arenosa]MBD8488018.1 LacI family DNA-binding transcriptional regulator [Echinicola arenosa]